jgi:hypothetical protein
VGDTVGALLGLGVGEPTTTVMATLVAVAVAAAERVAFFAVEYTFVMVVEGSSTMPEP